jgi:hypothetical protein
MSEMWLVFSVAGMVALLGLVFVWRLSKKGWKHETDYRAFFYMGLVWFPLGVVLDFPVFYILGLVYLIMGLANRDKWDKKQPLTPEQIRYKKIATVAAVAVLIAGVAAFMLFI